MKIKKVNYKKNIINYYSKTFKIYQNTFNVIKAVLSWFLKTNKYKRIYYEKIS